MPTVLGSGLVVFNVTPHPIHFWCGDEIGVVTAPTDFVLNAQAFTRTVNRNHLYTLVNMHFAPLDEGREKLREIREEYPDAVIVGSVIAAEAYSEWVVSPINLRSSRLREQNTLKLVRSDKFTTFKEIPNGY